MSPSHTPLKNDDFKIGIICALPREGDGVEALIDEFYEDPEFTYSKVHNDPIAYTAGRIGKHKVILAQMAEMGKIAATTTVIFMKQSFMNIEVALVVGICGGMPHGEAGRELFLGDVVVSDGLVQYDLGRQYPHGFERKKTYTDRLRPLQRDLLAFLKTIQSTDLRHGLEEQTAAYLGDAQRVLGSKVAGYPGAEKDTLFPSSHLHQHSHSVPCGICHTSASESQLCPTAFKSSCEELNCDQALTQGRRKRSEILGSPGTIPPPAIHFGRIASGDTVIKSGKYRDRIAAKEDVVAFEMEGTGVWTNLPCLVIKSVCDYADSHKNKRWQSYASVTAASCTKAFLHEYTSASDLRSYSRAG